MLNRGQNFNAAAFYSRKIDPPHIDLGSAAELYEVPMADLMWLQEHDLLGDAQQFAEGVRFYNVALVCSALDLWRVAFERAPIVCANLPRYRRLNALLHDAQFVRASAGHLGLLALGAGAR